MIIEPTVELTHILNVKNAGADKLIEILTEAGIDHTVENWGARETDIIAYGSEKKMVDMIIHLREIQAPLLWTTRHENQTVKVVYSDAGGYYDLAHSQKGQARAREEFPLAMITHWILSPQAVPLS